MFFTYILYSKSTDRFYIGHTEDLAKRIAEHNRGKSKFSRKGVPWELIRFFECKNKSKASILEDKIKKRGCKRFLEDCKD